MGILIKNNIVNQKGNPAWYESSLATRPIANIQGRMFVDTDTPSTGIYRDNGTTWDQVADPGAGSSGTLQQVTTNGSSTNVGISISANGIGIGTAIPGANILDIHGTTGVLAQLENTGAQNSLLSFRNQGAGVWSIGNGYNAGANDFIVYDAVSFVNRFTIKSTGQTFIGSDTTSSGLFVVNSSTSDNHIVVLGANGPSVRLRNAGTSPSLNVGLGISTAANNFIQGSASGNFCIFNASTTASPILFGVYDSGAGNTQEAARISASRNFLINTTVDSGYKLSVNGTTNLTSTLTVGPLGTGAAGIQLSGNDQANTRLKISNIGSGGMSYSVVSGNPGTSNAGFAIYDETNSATRLYITNAGNIGINTFSPNYVTANRTVLDVNGTNTSLIALSVSGTPKSYFYFDGNDTQLFSKTSLGLYSNSTERLRIEQSTGNVLIGTTTDNGAKLFVNGNISSYGNIGIGTNGASTGNRLEIVGTNGIDNALFLAGISGVTNGFSIKYVNSTTRIIVNIRNIPTSATGLSSGDVYSNLGILTIVP